MKKLFIKNSTRIKVSVSLFKNLILATEKVLNKKIEIVSINLAGQKKITEINRLYRHKNGPTDTISFAFQETIKFPQENILGEIFISLPQIKINARKYGVTFREELKSVFAHSLLHLLGYNHDNEKEEERMEELTKKIQTSNSKYQINSKFKY